MIAHRTVERWIEQHLGTDTDVLDPRSLGRDNPDVDALALALALNDLVQSGKFAQVYKVITPSGGFAADDFDDPRKIPAQLLDQFSNNSFDTAKADIVPIFKMQ